MLGSGVEFRSLSVAPGDVEPAVKSPSLLLRSLSLSCMRGQHLPFITRHSKQACSRWLEVAKVSLAYQAAIESGLLCGHQELTQLASRDSIGILSGLSIDVQSVQVSM